MCCNKIVKPTEPKIIKAIEPNNSNLINAELVYIPTNPKINANTFMVVGIEKFGFFDLVENISHAPINPNTMNIDKNSNEYVKLVD